MYRTVLGQSSNPGLEAVIVAYGPAESLDACLGSLGRGIPVTVVDNSSSVLTAEVARSHGALYVDAGRNLGFAAGVNLGLREIAARSGTDVDVLLLNPDAGIDADSVKQMQRQLRESPRVAAIGATQTEPDTGHTARVWWPFPTPFGAWMEAIGLSGLHRRRDFTIGSVLLLRAEALAQLGGLDERFFLYAEETDWQYRARRAGWSIEVAEVTATHEGAGTGGDPVARETYFYASLERYVRKHHGAVGWWSFRTANLLGALVRGALLPGDRGAGARRRARIFRVGPVTLEAGLR
jgi:GT2 family glycosyltransferase